MDDEQAIKLTVQRYIDGAVAGNSQVMKPSFHSDAHVAGFLNAELFAARIDGLFDWIDQTEAASSLTVTETKINIVGTIASVQLELKDWNGVDFTDIFSLLKIDGEWMIMNKVFHAHE